MVEIAGVEQVEGRKRERGEEGCGWGAASRSTRARASIGAM